MEKSHELERYATVATWGKELGISKESIARRIEEVRGITGKTITGRVLEEAFFPESQVRTVCADFLQDYPWANSDGFFTMNEIQYGTIAAWANAFGVSQQTLSKRLESSAGITGRTSIGHILQQGFYPEDTVRNACSDLIGDLPEADADGFFIQSDKFYGSVVGWARHLKVSSPTIKKKLVDAQGMKGKIPGGQILDFFSEATVREKCPKLFEVLPAISDDGFFTEEGSRFGTIPAWAEELSLGLTTLRRKLEGASGKTGRFSNGTVAQVFYENFVREKCASLLVDVPNVGEDGFFLSDFNGRIERFAATSNWAKELGISNSTVISNLNGQKGITGRDRTGRVQIEGLYAESQIREACRLLLIEAPQADESGFFVLGTEKYGSIYAWAKEIGTGDQSISTRLKSVTGIDGRISTRVLLQAGFYSWTQIQRCCSDLLAGFPQADITNFFTDEINGSLERFATLSTWSDFFRIPDGFLRKKMEGRKGRSGRASWGQVCLEGFYPESVIRPHAEEFHNDYLTADEMGFIIKDGERYASQNKWAEEFSITSSTVSKRMRGQQGISGKDNKGRLVMNGFFSEKAARAACSDLLQDVPRADENGFILISGQRFATTDVWERELGLTQLKRKFSSLQGITGKDRNSQVREGGFYSETDVRNACAALLENLPQANSDGFIILQSEEGDEERYATLNRLAVLWEMTQSTMDIYVKEAKLTGISGKVSGGQVLEGRFYSEKEVRKACEPLFQELPTLTSDGFYYQGEGASAIKYGPIGNWSEELGIGDRTISRALKGVNGIQVRDRINRIQTAFSESIVREKCARFLQDLPTANEEGWILINEERHASLVTWGKVCGTSWNSLKNLMKGTQGITGRTKSGHFIEKGYYSESAIRSVLRAYWERKQAIGRWHPPIKDLKKLEEFLNVNATDQ